MSNSKKDITNEIIELTESNIKDMIYEIRGQKVMLDFDLARIYGYETKRFNEQIKNNKEKFPKKYRFRLTKVELLNFERSKNRPLNYGQQEKAEEPIYHMLLLSKVYIC